MVILRRNGYISSMRLRMRIFAPVVILAVLSLPLALMADPGDVEGSHDYAGIPRLPGFFITDYDEDNPAAFDFPVARPLPTDAAHIETVHAQGHRYIIRYELKPSAVPYSLLQIQQYFEKLTGDSGFTVEKNGAAGNVAETFHQKKAGHETWVYLEPAMAAIVLTVMEARETSAPTATGPTDDPLYTALVKNGHVMLPVSFQPSRPDLGSDVQPVIDRVIKMLQLHPDLLLRIEGHTDNTGEATDNQRLSAGRARAVQALLIAHGIDKDRLQAVGLGGLEPVADNGTAEGREKNRRIELVVRKDSPQFHSPAPNGTNYYPKTGTSSAP